MAQRINYMQQSPEFVKKLMELSNAEKESSIEQKIVWIDESRLELTCCKITYFSALTNGL